MVAHAGAASPLPWLAQPLQDALNQRRSHALLVLGHAGIGAYEFLQSLAQALLCEGPAPRPCGHCNSCHLAREHAHPDLFTLIPDALRVALGGAAREEESDGDGAKSKKKPSRQIRIDSVRAAIEWSSKTSSRAQAKVVLIHPAQAMNLQSASALLKTLEEPSSGVVLLLSAPDAGLLLPTVLSRCQTFRLPAPSRAEGLAWLSGQGVTDVEVLLSAAGGRPLDALALAQAGVSAPHWRALPQAVARGDASAFAGWSMAAVVDGLQKLCHDLWVASLGGQPVYFPFDSLRLPVPADALAVLIKRLTQVARHDEHPWNEGLLIDALVCEAQHLWPERRPATAPEKRHFDTLARR